MKLLMPALLLLFAVSSTAAEIYRHVDAQGRITYTDQPTDSAEPVALEPLNTLPATANPAATTGQHMAPGTPFTGYQSLVLTGVENGAILRNPTAPVTLGTRMQPQLQPGHSLLIHHNGHQANTDNVSSITVPDIERGSHTFRAEVLDADGQVLIQSYDLTIHVHRASALRRPGAGN
ncbi:MAG: DUF4124 domain-containing protein [Gammaproteobacteria bacterium]